MKILVIGSALVGQPVIEEAQSRGHEVTIGSRSGEFTVDITNTQQLAEAIDNPAFDATVIAVAGRNNLDATAEAHKALVEHGFNGRLLVVGGAGSLEVDGVRLSEMDSFPAEYKDEAIAFGKVLDAYRGYGKDNWTLVSPSPVLAPGAATGSIALGTDSPVGDNLTTGDLAVAIIDELENPQHQGARFTVASV
ncbi:MAG: NAD(P)H-binding protein [Corynebacterium sp.]|nr:NAD(P)H-binding protein [Corynebacterium sp.]